jgi:hypothetical protein
MSTERERFCFDGVSGYAVATALSVMTSVVGLRAKAVLCRCAEAPPSEQHEMRHHILLQLHWQQSADDTQ